MHVAGYTYSRIITYMSSSSLKKCPLLHNLVCNMLILFLCWVAFKSVYCLSNAGYKLCPSPTSKALLIQPCLNIGLEVAGQVKWHRQSWLLLPLGSHPCPDSCNSGFWIKLDSFRFRLGKGRRMLLNHDYVHSYLHPTHVDTSCVVIKGWLVT